MELNIYEDNRFLDEGGFADSFSNVSAQPTSSYPDPEETPIYPWLGGPEAVPPDQFLSIAQGSRGPLVHEGFIPENDQQSDQSEEGLGLEDDQFALWRAGDEDLNDPDYDSVEGAEDEPDDVEFSDEEIPDDDTRGPYARTRAKKVGKRGIIWDQGGTTYGRRIGRGFKGVKRGLRQAKAPSAEFDNILREANHAFYKEGNLSKALDAVQQAIALNPEVHAAHALLASVYKEQGELGKCAQALFLGAHANPRQSRVWRSAIEAFAEYLDNFDMDNRESVIGRIAYCYHRLINLNPNDYESILRRAMLEKERNRKGHALNQLQALLTQLPHNTEVLQLIAEICLDLKQTSLALTLYDDCITFNRSLNESSIHFSFSDILTYVELLAFDGNISDAIKALKSLSRWLLGRQAETYWDNVQDDDREWDAEDSPRRQKISEFRPNRFSLHTYGYGLPLELRIKLGLMRFKQQGHNSRQAFAHFEWLEPEDQDEGAKAYEYGDLFREVGDTFKEAKMYNEALRFYRPLLELDLVNDPNVALAAGLCQFEIDGFAKARDYFDIALKLDAESVQARIWLARVFNDIGDLEKGAIYAREAIVLGRQAIVKPHRRKYERKERRLEREKAENELKMAYKLKFPAKAREASKQRRAATLAMRPIAPIWTRRDGLTSDHRPPGHDMAQSSDAEDIIESIERAEPENRTQRLRQGNSTTELQEQEQLERQEELRTLYDILLTLQPKMRTGDLDARDAWLDAADALIRAFRTERVFYPHDRLRFTGYDENAETSFRRRKRQEAEEIDTPMRNLPDEIDGDTIPNDYCGIPFDNWLDVFLEFAFILSSMGEARKEACYSVLNQAADCSIWYHSTDALTKIYVAYASCALRLNDSETMLNTVARWFMTRFQFVSDAYRLFDALSLLWRMPNANRRSQMQHAHFKSGPSQKFMLRQIKAVDLYLPENYGSVGEAGPGPVPEFMRSTKAGRTVELPKLKSKDGEPIRPQEMDIVLLVLYGHILYAGGSFLNAVNYFSRAYALDPSNPMVLLSLALAYCHGNFKRQNEDRHGYIVQGLAFLGEYREARMESVKDCSAPVRDVVRMEVEFNEARFWHMLGLSGIAVHAYRKALEVKDLSQGEDGPAEDFSMETAFALQQIYFQSGDVDTARRITEKYLVLE
ncbi:MAG: hypothetical protein Q9227_007280 [Pyrenula ochraceoflavens]